jgi:hypothetical protein
MRAVDAARRGGTAASDVVDGILSLESSPYITGEIVHIDGAPKSPGHGR